MARPNGNRQEGSDGEPCTPRLLTVQDIQHLGFDWPKHALIKQYLLMEGDRVDLPQTIERMQSSRAFYRKQINDAYAFKQQTGADYADFTDRFDDIVRMESELARSIDYRMQILVAADQPQR